MQNAAGGPALSNENFVRRFVRAAEIDTRMIGMLVALLVIWVGFDVISGFLRPGGSGVFKNGFSSVHETVSYAVTQFFSLLKSFVRN